MCGCGVGSWLVCSEPCVPLGIPSTAVPGGAAALLQPGARLALVALGQSPPPLGHVGKKTLGSFACFLPWPGISVLKRTVPKCIFYFVLFLADRKETFPAT